MPTYRPHPEPDKTNLRIHAVYSNFNIILPPDLQNAFSL
jgi:hypothetical protein